MQTVNTINDVRSAVREARLAGKRVGFVPTMGGLHDGHFSLIDAACKACDYVVVSIFLNPTQFTPGEDLSKYPSTPEEDIAACESREVNLVFMPDVETMYGPGEGGLTNVSVGRLGDGLCGRSRPTHFAGVCTVVSKLFNIVSPDMAFFGEKDYQQAAIIRQMVRDLDFPVEIRTCPIVREADGLAMSTRNRYLSAGHRQQACGLHGSLKMAADMISGGSRDGGQVKLAVRAYLGNNAPDGEIDYVEIVDSQDLADVGTIGNSVLVAIAVKFANARLIDNMVVEVG